jgi:hypothetical protein
VDDVSGELARRCRDVNVFRRLAPEQTLGGGKERGKGDTCRDDKKFDSSAGDRAVIGRPPKV